MMLQDTVFKLLTPQDTLRIERGRCLRHRLSFSSCQNCFDSCATGAMSWAENGLHWEQEKCTGCLLCVAGCPTDALTSNQLPLSDLLQRLDEVDRPLLSCSFKPQTLGHARVPCSGLLADPELLLVLQLALGKELQLNLSACSGCENSSIVTPLNQAIITANRIAEGLPGAIRPVYSEAQLAYQEKNCSRREFFSFLNRRSRQTGISLVNRLQVDSQQGSYGKKTLPLARRLLLQLTTESTDIKTAIRHQLLPEIHIAPDLCRGCTSCVGICPTGVLSRAEKKGAPPDSKKDHCTACNLCVEFCRQAAITITRCP